MKNKISIVIVSGVLVLTACQRQPQTLEDRAQARWDALLNDNIEVAYGYFSPGYRSSVTLEDYRARQARRRVGWVGADYAGHECNDDSACTVTINVEYQVTAPMRGIDQWESTRQVQEQWVKTDEKWWFIPAK